MTDVDLSSAPAAASLRAWLSATMGSSPDFVALASADGRLLHLNAAGRQIVGLDPLGGSASGAVLTQLLADALPDALATGRWEGESTLHHVGGEMVGVRGLVVAHPSAESRGGAPYLTMTLRAAPARTVQLTPEAVAERRFLAEAMPTHVWTATPDGRVDYCSHAAQAYLGMSLADVRHDGWHQKIHPADFALARDVWQAHLASGEPYRHETRVLRQDGEYRWQSMQATALRDEHGTIVRWYGSMVDVHDIRVANAELERERGFLRGVLDSLADHVSVCTADGELLLFGGDTRRRGETWERGAPLEQWSRQYNVYLPDGVTHFPTEQMPLLRVLETGARVPDVVMVVDTPGVGARTMVASAAPMRGRDGTLLGSVCITRDVTAQFSSERALRASESFTRSILEASPDCVKTLDLEGQLLTMNQAGLCAMDVDEFATVAGVDWSSFWVQGGMEDDARRAVATARAGGRAQFQGRCATIKGVDKWWDVVVTCIPGEDGRPVRLLAVSRDITESRNAELARQREHDFLSAVLANLHDGVAACDADGRLTLFNRATREFHGIGAESVGPEEWAGRYSLYAPDGRTPLSADEIPLNRALRGEEVKDLEMVIAPKGMRPRTVLASGRRLRSIDGKIVGAVVVMHDETDRRRAHALAETTERRFRKILETVRALSLCLDVDGRVTFCNEAVSALTGTTREALVGQDWFALYTPREAGAGDEFRRFMAAGAIPAHLESELVTGSGDRRLISWDNTLLYDDLGAIVGTASIGRDITDAERMQTQLRQAQKMEAVGQLAGGVAHDFNNLLTAIKCSVEFLREAILPGDASREDVDQIADATDRAAALTRQLLAFSRRQTLEPHAVSASDVVDGISKMLRRLLGPEIDIQLALGTGSGEVHVDRGQLEQVIVNLAINARDAMERGGTLVISTGEESIRGASTHQHGVVPAGDYITLVMRDTGVGMDERTLARLFEPFFTTKELGKGTGLGLSTAFGIVQQSGGQIVVTSALGVGTTFTVYLPRIVADDPAASGRGLNVDPSAVRVEAGTPPIIVVDDEDSVRTTIVRILARAGHSVIAAEGGAAALQLIERLRASGTEPGLVITDVMMPGMNGRELAIRLATDSPSLPVLFVSGYSADDVFRADDGARAYPMLNKPFTPHELTLTVNRLIHDAAEVESVIV